jgi:hypothetical protein
MNTTKADSPVVDMLREELKFAREELKSLHAKIADKEEPKPKSLFDQLTEFASSEEKLAP